MRSGSAQTYVLHLLSIYQGRLQLVSFCTRSRTPAIVFYTVFGSDKGSRYCEIQQNFEGISQTSKQTERSERIRKIAY